MRLNLRFQFCVYGFEFEPSATLMHASTVFSKADVPLLIE
ncbi:hypothetical protein NBRC111894_3692 [Sporolactobacillus inulinus]|uniref:Uncharacterized protein n=1 Tax=Sporolactobacillus inulinus TaxID=2078 RepID=A0A4Y1ZIF6_9BACL|nr:hypothetical protein NBRC111894_3692 [Sporolactobacillus inulinus]